MYQNELTAKVPRAPHRPPRGRPRARDLPALTGADTRGVGRLTRALSRACRDLGHFGLARRLLAKPSTASIV